METFPSTGYLFSELGGSDGTPLITFHGNSRDQKCPVKKEIFTFKELKYTISKM